LTFSPRSAFWAALVVAACNSNAPARAEAERMVHAVRELREADNDEKTPRLAALRASECNEPEVCALRDQCVRAYELYVKGLDQVRAVKKSLASDAGGAAALRARELLDEAEKNVRRGRELAEGCNRKEAEVSVRFKLP
jgi:hypothetical protein